MFESSRSLRSCRNDHADGSKSALIKKPNHQYDRTIINSAHQKSKFEHVLKSSCNFSLGCDDSIIQLEATKMIGQQQQRRQQQQQKQSGDGAHSISGSRISLELQAAENEAANSTIRLFYPQGRFAKYSNHIKQQHSKLLDFNQADAASAMVGLVRIILVILICVLLVKLHAIPGVGSFKTLSSNKSGQQRYNGRSRKRRISSRRQVASGDEEDSEFQRATRKISVEEQQKHRQAQEEIRMNVYKNQTNLGRIFSKFSITSASATSRLLNTNTSPQRRFSQPVLATFSTPVISATTNWQHKALNANERRRRHSDTNAMISSLQLPPGPIGLPFLGYLPFLGTEIHLTLTELSQRFGPIYQIFLGGIRVVVLNDAALVRQAFKQTVFSGRPDTQLTRILQGYGIVNSDGALWKEQRAFLHSALRKLGAKSLMSGTNGLEAKIQNQVREFVNDLSSHAGEGKPCQVRPIVARAVSSVVGSVVMNLTYRKYEEKFDRLIELMQEGFRLFSIAMPLDFIPIFRFLPGVSYAYKKMKRNRAETSAFFQTVADEHRRYLSETFNLNMPNTASSLHPKVSQLEAKPNSIPKTILTSDTITRTIVKQQSLIKAQMEPTTELENIVARDLVDAYIMQQKKHENDGKENYFSDQQLVQIMSDIFSAGLETVTSTIEWSILFLILNPECQEKIQNEIDRVVGRCRLPQLEDLAQMPYTEATIYEVLRRSNVVALGNAHATLADATIGGYRIPKGTQVLPNLYGIHMNPKLWTEPEKFNPSRFIVNERAQKPDYFIPFSVGRRMCLGDVLAKMEVFLFLVGLLQKYDLSVHESDRACPPKVKGTIGVSNAPVPFRVALKVRDNVSTSSGIVARD